MHHLALCGLLTLAPTVTAQDAARATVEKAVRAHGGEVEVSHDARKVIDAEVTDLEFIDKLDAKPYSGRRRGRSSSRRRSCPAPRNG